MLVNRYEVFLLLQDKCGQLLQADRIRLRAGG
jgi:hypothetical protein